MVGATNQLGQHDQDLEKRSQSHRIGP